MAAVVVLTDRPATSNQTWSDDLLRQAGYDVIVAEDAEAGLAAAAEGQAMLIVLRSAGNTLDACNVCRVIRTHPVTRAIPLLVVTRVDDPYTRDQFVRAGATAILMEPPRATLLLRQVRRLMGRHAAALHRAGDQGASAASAV
jgi:two-component system phosphate regulon response regulator PhoB